MIYTIVAAVIFFLVVILSLVSILLFAKSKLLPSGEVTLTINGQKNIQINPGGTILGTLGDNKYFYPQLVVVVVLVQCVNVKLTQGVGKFYLQRNLILLGKKYKIIGG